LVNPGDSYPAIGCSPANISSYCTGFPITRKTLFVTAIKSQIRNFIRNRLNDLVFKDIARIYIYRDSYAFFS